MRINPVAFTGDIISMFLRIRLLPEDRKFHRFVWSFDPREAPTTYEFLSHVFGNVGSPAVANFVVKEHALKYQKEYPLAFQTVHQSMLVDDVVDSAEDAKVARETIRQLILLHKKAGMELRKWASNSDEALKDLEPSQKARSVELAKILSQVEEYPVIKTLGLIWQTEEDLFRFEQSGHDVTGQWTRRKLLSTVAKLFDPLGLLAPYIIMARMTLQDLVIRQDRIADPWDELLPKDLEKEWKVWYEQLSELDTIQVARCVRKANSKANDLTLHVFCDASKTAFASCAYIVSKNDESRVSRLLIAKARVAPVKVVTVPRLELLGAVLSTSLVACINSNLDHPFNENNTYYWTDSMNVLCWLRNQSRDLKTFVANRVSHIQRHSDISQWQYINTTQNPADLATRGLSVEQLQNSDLWWKGPELLLADEPIAHDEPRVPLLEAVKEFRPSKAPFAQSSGWTVQLMAVIFNSKFNWIGNFNSKSHFFMGKKSAHHCVRCSIQSKTKGSLLQKVHLYST